MAEGEGVLLQQQSNSITMHELKASQQLDIWAAVLECKPTQKITL